MRGIKYGSLLAATILFCVYAIGCTVQSGSTSPVAVFSVKARELEEPAYGEQEASIIAAAEGANKFAFRLSAALSKDIGAENFVCSPYSVWLPLAALLNATDAENKAALLGALSMEGITEQDVNRAASRMLYDLTKVRNIQFARENKQEVHNPLKIANAIFVDRKYTLKKEFAQTFMDYFRGQTMNVDFSDASAADAVNEWASDNTDGLITDIVQEFDPNTVAAMANALYFSDRWSWEFDPDKTMQDVFYSANGETTASFMLREGENQMYYEDDRVQAMPVQFLSGGGMYIILPKNTNALGLLHAMDYAYFNEIQEDAISATGKLLLPRFSIESEVMNLNDALMALAIPLFDEKKAPLTGGLVEENISVWLSDVVQKAVIKVDEKGTTAAAVTVIPTAGEGMPVPTEPFEMNCNKPFVFILYDSTYDGGRQILFTGIVNQP